MRRVTFICLALAFACVPMQAAGAAGAPGSQGLDSWGDFGQQGPVSPLQPTPTAVAGVPGVITQLVATNAASYALTSSGQVWAWGAGTLGELGNGADTSSFTAPVQVSFPAGTVIRTLAAPAPYATAIAIDSTGHAWGWGDNKVGSLCLGNRNKQPLPVELPFSDVTSASGGGVHALYVADGKTYSCGSDRYGELGNGTFQKQDQTKPVKVKGLKGAPVALFADYATSGALMADGSYYDWGNGTSGQLGDGLESDSATPILVSLPSKPVNIFLGGNTSRNGQTIAVLSNGSVVVWGSDAYGQLCDGQVTHGVPAPETITTPGWVSVTSGGTSTYGLDASGNLWSCGSDLDGALGDGKVDSTPITTPEEVLTSVTMLSSTSHNVVALRG